MMQQQVDTQTLQEQNSILKEMLYTMQDLVMSSRNNEKWNAQTANKNLNLNGKEITKEVNKNLGMEYMNTMMNMGGGLT